jgi:hypothetical protein
VLMSRKQATQRFGAAAIPGPSPADLIAAGAAASVTLLPSRVAAAGHAHQLQQQLQVQPEVPATAGVTEQDRPAGKMGHRGHAVSNFSSGSAPGVVSSSASGCPSEAGSGYESTTTNTTSSAVLGTGRHQVLLQRTGSSDSATDEASESAATTATLHSNYCANAVALVAALELQPSGEPAARPQQHEPPGKADAEHAPLDPPICKAKDGVHGMPLQQPCQGQVNGAGHASDVPDEAEQAGPAAGPVAERSRSRQAHWFRSYAYPITDEVRWGRVWVGNSG